MTEADLNKYFLTKRTPYVKPFYSIDIHDDKKIIDWFREATYNLGQYYRPLFREQHENLQLFMGAGINPNFATPYAAVYAAQTDFASQSSVSINELYRVTMDQISLVISHELVPDVLPNSEDYSDKVACNVVKEWLESMNYTMNTEGWRFRWELAKKMFGECYVICMWNSQIGDLHPLARKMVDEDIALVDEDEQPISDLGGNPMNVRKNTRIGDIQFVTPYPWDVFIDPQNNFELSNWFFWREYLDVEYLKRKFPKFKWDNAGVGTTDQVYDIFSNSEKENPNQRLVYYFYHKSNEFLPEGRFVVCTKEHILINEPLTMETIIDNQDLPIVRFLDLDMGYGVRGIPILFRNTKTLNNCYNVVTNQMYNNVEMESPKLYIHETSGVDGQRMDNGIVAIEWTGEHRPVIECPVSNNASIFNFREAIKKNIDEMALQNPMVRGDTPNAQLDSFIALQHFEDIRNQLASQDIKGHMRSMEHLYRLMITIARDKYKKSDGRLIKILGRHNTYQLKFFDPINLQKSYDVKISTTGNLANSKAARTQMMITIKREFPNAVTDDFFLDSLGLSHSKKFMNAITSAVSSAESENQEMMEGNQVLEPTRYEDLIAHWDSHRIPMQSQDFKQSPQEVIDLFIGHVAMTEKLMFEQASENPAFAERLNTLRQFPMIYTPKPVNEAPPPQPIGPDGMPLQPPQSAPQAQPAPDQSLDETVQPEMLS